jgi:hypothetical protein
MPIHHTPDHPDSFDLDYTGQACTEGRHDSCPAWWGRGCAGTRCACPCHLPEEPAPTDTPAYQGEDVLLFVSFYCKAGYHHHCPRRRQPANRCACPCHHPDQRPD